MDCFECLCITKGCVKQRLYLTHNNASLENFNSQLFKTSIHNCESRLEKRYNYNGTIEVHNGKEIQHVAAR